MFIASSNKIGS